MRSWHDVILQESKKAALAEITEVHECDGMDVGSGGQEYA